jgi:four helix bundle protein
MKSIINICEAKLIIVYKVNKVYQVHQKNMGTKFTTFEDIIAWQKANALTKEIYLVFKNCRDYSFRDQIQRAVISITNNIAEGYERKGNKEFSQFLFIAKGSCGEVRSMLYSALEIGYINKEEFNKFKSQTVEISRMLSGLIMSLK